MQACLISPLRYASIIRIEDERRLTNEEELR